MNEHEEEIISSEDEDVVVLSNERALKWIKPGDNFHTQWDHFKRSNTKNVKTNRYVAKCNHCELEMEGRVDRMKGHTMKSCAKIPRDERRKFIEQQAKGFNRSSLDESKTPPTSSSKTTLNSSNYFRPISNELTSNLHSTLLKAFISGGIPFRFAEKLKQLKYFLAGSKIKDSLDC